MFIYKLLAFTPAHKKIAYAAVYNHQLLGRSKINDHPWTHFFLHHNFFAGVKMSSRQEKKKEIPLENLPLEKNKNLFSFKDCCFFAVKEKKMFSLSSRGKKRERACKTIFLPLSFLVSSQNFLQLIDWKKTVYLISSGYIFLPFYKTISSGTKGKKCFQDAF